MTALGDLDRDRIRELHDAELAWFRAERPRTLELLGRAAAHMPNGTPMAWMASDNDLPVYVDRGEGASFTDVDGHRYVDFNASDLAMFCGHAHPAIVRAVQERVARSTQFLLPTEESVIVAEELARRYPLQTHWQFTLSASQANTEAIRLARAATGRDVVLLFEGHYHGHFDEGLVDLEDGRPAPVQRGLSKGVTGRVRITQFNDVEGLRTALGPDDVAIVLTEPALTNNIHFLPPEPGWHDELRGATRERGAVLAFDETHTHVVGEGGSDRAVESRARRGHDRQGGGGRHPDGRVRRQRRARPGARPLEGERRDRRDALREPAVGGGGYRGAHRGAGPRGLRAHDRVGRDRSPTGSTRRCATRGCPGRRTGSVLAPASGTGPTRGREPTRTR